MMRPFAAHGSIVRSIWGDADTILFAFAGSAAEFALNRAVDWLNQTGKLPDDPMGRLFSTARFAREIVFADEDTARQTLTRIRAAHKAVERSRYSEWAPPPRSSSAVTRPRSSPLKYPLARRRGGRAGP